MKNRLADLQRRLDAAVQAYRDHTGKEISGPDADAHATEAARLKASMDAAAAAVRAERDAAEAERLLTPVRQAVDREESITGGEDRARLDPRGGFGSIAEFVRSVFGATSAINNGRAIDKRLVFEAAAPTGYGNESTGADGGYLVPPEFAREVYAHSLSEGSFMPWTTQLPVSGNSITYPKDETTPWGTNGIRMRWSSEATAASQDKPVIGEGTLKLRKLIGLCPLTDEMVQDAAFTAQYVRMMFGRSMAWKTNDAIINGIGGQIPRGIKNSGAIVTVSKESGQAVDTFVTENSTKMLGRLSPAAGASNNTKWVINHDVWQQIPLMKIGDTPVWTPPGTGFKDAPYGYLHGRPIVLSQTAQTLGDLGDIYLIDFAQYMTISKGPEYAESMHFFFDADAMAFRVTFRMDGQPWMSAPITPNNGANTLSAFVQLEAR